MIGNTFQFAWEVKLIEWCQIGAPTFIVDFFKLASSIGDILLVAMVGVFYLWYDKKLGKDILLTTVLSMVFSAEIKNIFKRRRPYFDNENIECLKIVDEEYDLYDVKKQGFSFPSMHSSSTTSVFGTIYNYYRKNSLLVLAVVISLIIGISRFVLGCHYPTDVLVGWGIGVLSIIVYDKASKKFSNKQIYIGFIILFAIGCTYCQSADFYQAVGLGVSFMLCEAFDKKYTNFKNTRNATKGLLRLIFALVVFALVSQGMKLPFSKEFLEGDGFASNAFLVIRYGASTFAAMGLTPLLYKYNIFKLDDK